MESLKNNRILEFQPNPAETLRKRYNMENERLEQSIKILQDWINKQRHFVSHDYDRDYLEKSIFSCKASVEKAKRQIDRLCTLRTLVPKFFITEDIRKNLEELFDVACIMVSPKQTKDYERLMLIKLSEKEFTPKILMSYYRFNVIMCEYLKLHDYTDGYIAILDFREANLLDINKQLNPVEVQQILTVMIEGYGAKIKGIHMLSHSKVIHLLIKLLKPFLSEKIANRIHVHEENEELYSIIDKEMLPIEYGGTERSIYQLSAMWLDEFSSPKFEAYLAKMAAMSTNESLRLTEKFNEDCIGLPGSFRTLSVD